MEINEKYKSHCCIIEGNERGDHQMFEKTIVKYKWNYVENKYNINQKITK